MLKEIGNESSAYTFNGSDHDMLESALETLRGSGPRGSLEAQLLALWLNYKANYTDGHELVLPNGTSLGPAEIIEYAEGVLVAGDRGRYEEAKDLCEAYNTGWEE